MTMPLMDLVRQVEYMLKPLFYLAHQIQQRHGHTHMTPQHILIIGISKKGKESKPQEIGRQ